MFMHEYNVANHFTIGNTDGVYIAAFELLHDRDMQICCIHSPFCKRKIHAMSSKVE